MCYLSKKLQICFSIADLLVIYLFFPFNSLFSLSLPSPLSSSKTTPTSPPPPPTTTCQNDNAPHFFKHCSTSLSSTSSSPNSVIPSSITTQCLDYILLFLGCKLSIDIVFSFSHQEFNSNLSLLGFFGVFVCVCVWGYEELFLRLF